LVDVVHGLALQVSWNTWSADAGTVAAAKPAKVAKVSQKCLMVNYL
jgi:hypothetical protein